MTLTEEEKDQYQQDNDRLLNSLFFPGLVVVILWAVHWAGHNYNLTLQAYGVRPGVPVGLWGIVTMPFIHGGVGHLISNSLPLIFLGAGSLYLYPKSSLRMLPLVYILSGTGVWFLGRPGSVHIGASGINYGLVTFIFISGIIRGQPRALALACLVTFVYGSMVYGLIPLKGISWEGHLSGALAGAGCALWLRKLDPPRNRHRPLLDDEYPNDFPDDNYTDNDYSESDSRSHGKKPPSNQYNNLSSTNDWFDHPTDQDKK